MKMTTPNNAANCVFLRVMIFVAEQSHAWLLPTQSSQRKWIRSWIIHRKWSLTNWIINDDFKTVSAIVGRNAILTSRKVLRTPRLISEWNLKKSPKQDQTATLSKNAYFVESWFHLTKRTCLNFKQKWGPDYGRASAVEQAEFFRVFHTNLFMERS